MKVLKPKHKEEPLEKLEARLHSDTEYSDVESWAFLAHKYYKKGLFDKAASIYRRLNQQHLFCQNKKYIRNRLQYSSICLKEEKFDEAKAILNAIREIDQSDFEYIYQMSCLLFHEKEYGKCITYLRVLDSSNEYKSEISAMVGLCYYYRGLYVKAIKYLKTAINKEVISSSEVLYAYSDSLYNTGYVGAENIKFLEILQMDIAWSFRSLFLQAKIAIKNKDLEKAAGLLIRALEKGQEISPEDSEKLEANYLLGRLYISNKEINKAMPFLKNVRDINPDYRGINSLLTRYQEVPNNPYWQTYLQGEKKDLFAVLRLFIQHQHKGCIINFQSFEGSYYKEKVDIVVRVTTRKWEEKIAYHFMRDESFVPTRNIIDDFSDSIISYKYDLGVYIALSEPTEEIQKRITTRPINFIGRKQFANLLMEIYENNHSKEN